MEKDDALGFPDINDVAGENVQKTLEGIHIMSGPVQSDEWEDGKLSLHTCNVRIQNYSSEQHNNCITFITIKQYYINTILLLLCFYIFI